MKQYFLTGKRLGLRQLCIDDIDGNYSSWLNDPEVCRYNTHHRFPKSKTELEKYVNGLKFERNLVLAVELLEQEEHIGNISLQNISMIDRNAEIAFLFGEKSCWGNGYAAESARLLIDHAFLELGLIRIYFGTSSDNMPMQRLGEKLNFKKEGIRRKAIFKKGRFLDIYDYGLIREQEDIL